MTILNDKETTKNKDNNFISSNKKEAKFISEFFLNLNLANFLATPKYPVYFCSNST